MFHKQLIVVSDTLALSSDRWQHTDELHLERHWASPTERQPILISLYQWDLCCRVSWQQPVKVYHCKNLPIVFWTINFGNLELSNFINNQLVPQVPTAINPKRDILQINKLIIELWLTSSFSCTLSEKYIKAPWDRKI